MSEPNPGSIRRLLLVNYEFPPVGGGAATATAAMAEAFARQGIETLVVTGRFRGQPALERRGRLTIRRIPTIRRHASRCAIWEMTLFMVSALLCLPFLTARWRPDFTLAFFGIPCGPAAWLLKRLYGIPYAVLLRGGDVPGYQHRGIGPYHAITRPVIRWLWHQADHVIANSAGLAALAQQTSTRPIAVIANGVDAGFFRPPDRTGADPSPAVAAPAPTLLFAGRIVETKGLPVLLTALTRVPEPWRLLVIGDGPERAAAAALAERLGLSGRVRFSGWLDRAALAETYRQADLFVLPSLDEGMPNVVLEAMASGLAVIATRVAGSSDLVSDGVTGRLVPPGDSVSLAAAIAALLARPDQRHALAAAARAAVERSHSWQAVADAYLAQLMAPAVTANRPAAAAPGQRTET